MITFKEVPLELISYLEDPINNVPDDLFYKAVLTLWRNNIFTNRSYVDESGKFAVIELFELDDVNEKVFNDLVRAEKQKAYYRKGKRLIVVKFDPNWYHNVKQELFQIVSSFKMQILTYGFKTIEEFLRDECGCFTMVENPDYKELPNMNFGQMMSGELATHFNSSSSEPYIKVYDESKVTKDLREYLQIKGKEDLYLPEKGLIFENTAFMNQYLSYKQHSLR